MSFFKLIQYLVLVYLVLLFVMVGCDDATSASKSTTVRTLAMEALIEPDDAGSAYFPQIAIDAKGNALAVWSKSDGNRSNIWARRYTVSTNSWGRAVKIETDDAGNAYDPQIVTDASGNALVVWSQNDGSRLNIWSNRYIASANSWAIAELIETNISGHANDPQLTIDASGNAVAVWTENRGVHPQYWTNRYDAATGQWGRAAMIDTDNAVTASYRQ
jgi:hypothetical protein